MTGWLFPALVLAFLLMLATMEHIGRRTRRFRRGGAEIDSEEADGIGYVLTSVFGLLALLIGFTFSVALNRYEDRRVDVVDEANAIGTAYFRADFATGLSKEQLQEALKSYASSRLQFGLAEKSQRMRLVRQSVLERDKVIASAREALATIAGSPAAPSLASAINEVLDVGARREANLRTKVPDSVIIVLSFSSGAAAFMIGFARAGTSRTTRSVNYLLFLLLSMAVMMILDIDSPAVGTTLVSQQPMFDLVSSLSGQLHGVK